MTMTLLQALTEAQATGRTITSTCWGPRLVEYEIDTLRQEAPEALHEVVFAEERSDGALVVRRIRPDGYVETGSAPMCVCVSPEDNAGEELP